MDGIGIGGRIVGRLGATGGREITGIAGEGGEFGPEGSVAGVGGRCG